MRKRRRLHRPTAVGASPGTILPDPDAVPTKLSAFVAGPHGLSERPSLAASDIKPLREGARVVWLNVEGLGDTQVLKGIGQEFGLHPLTLEDIANVHQRPKVEEFDDYQFLVMRIITLDQEPRVSQMSLVLGNNFVLTFSERPTTNFNPVIDRLRRQTQRLRDGGADYWAYALIDALIDRYFPILEGLSDRLENIEAEVLGAARPQSAQEINHLRRDLLELRRAIWPLREELNTLARSDAFYQRDTATYLRDAHDHCLMLIDILETLREVAAGLMDLYLSSVSNRMNEVMKVLTIISTIFIPLTFIAGIYGMNFNPQSSPYNMPELEAYWGYPLALGSMLLVGVGFAGYMWRRGWFVEGALPARER